MLAKLSLNIRSFVQAFLGDSTLKPFPISPAEIHLKKYVHAALLGQKVERKSKMKAELESGSWVIKDLSVAGVLRVAPICQRERCVFSSASVRRPGAPLRR